MTKEKTEEARAKITRDILLGDDAGSPNSETVELSGREVKVVELNVGDVLDTDVIPDDKSGGQNSARAITRIMLAAVDPETGEKIFETADFQALRDARGKLREHVIELLRAYNRVSSTAGNGSASESDQES